MNKIPYKAALPPAVRELVEGGLMPRPTQSAHTFRFTTHVDITYKLRGCRAATFGEWNSTILMAALQDCERYARAFPTERVMFTGNVEVTIGRRKKAWGIHTAVEPDVFVHGPPYDVPQYDLSKVFKEILDIPARYKVKDYKVTRIVISPYVRT